ncbi:MAG: Crp/Fnr family transcriptional regulator [Spirochaetaceae bacterium]|jgi:CRP-like cAMP-binding protein|nr:Crp/Fnr family transcriptional regulator [Spirochaetaceae bacterium]
MPKLMQFRSGMTVYIEGDEDERVFILQNGLVSLVYADVETGKFRQDVIQQGEFFGVKSALGKYPREETATVKQDSTVIMFSVPEFEAVAMKNPRIIMQMLKVYSSQLRKISRLLSSLKIQSHIRRNIKAANTETGNDTVSPDDGLFTIGKYYMHKEKFDEASYVFDKYVQNYPQGRHLAEAQGFITFLKGRV